jgi:hypothetical protein
MTNATEIKGTRLDADNRSWRLGDRRTLFCLQIEKRKKLLGTTTNAKGKNVKKEQESTSSKFKGKKNHQQLRSTFLPNTH